jgi:hypothetical protein
VLQRSATRLRLLQRRHAARHHDAAVHADTQQLARQLRVVQHHCEHRPCVKVAQPTVLHRIVRCNEERTAVPDVGAAMRGMRCAGAPAMTSAVSAHSPIGDSALSFGGSQSFCGGGRDFDLENCTQERPCPRRRVRGERHTRTHAHTRL